MRQWITEMKNYVRGKGKSIHKFYFFYTTCPKWAAVRNAMGKHLRYEPTKTSRSRIKRLRGMRRPQYRLLVAEHRVFYDVTAEAVEVLAIVSKSKTAEWLERYGEPTVDSEESDS